MENSKLLIIDDQKVLRNFLSDLLSQNGYDTITASKGQEGLECIFNEMPDLVLLDISMPDMNGDKVLEVIRNDPRTQDIPVIIITAEEDVQTRIDLLKKGANDYIPKSFDEQEILARVSTQLRAREAYKLHTLLEFAGATAHEMNQPLQGVIGYCEILLTKINEESELYELAKTIWDCAERLAEIIKKLRKISRYKNKQYIGNDNIIDLESSIQD